MKLEHEDKIITEFLQSKVTGHVVSPGTWMFHKGLTFTRRKTNSKMHKDLYGIWYVATQLGEFSGQAIKEFRELSELHLKWFKTAKNNLLHWVENASPNEWSQLEAQDPYGMLKKLHFERTIKGLITSLSLPNVNNTSKIALGKY